MQGATNRQPTDHQHNRPHTPPRHHRDTAQAGSWEPVSAHPPLELTTQLSLLGKNCRLFWREKHFEVKTLKTPHVRTVLEVVMLKKCMPLWREAHVEVRMWKARNARTTVGRSTAPHDVITTSTATTATTTARTITTTATTASTTTATATSTLYYTFTTLHYTALHCTAPHCTTRPPNINNDDDYYYYCYYCYCYTYTYTYNYNYLFTTTSATTTTTSTLYHTASSRCRLDGHCNHSKKHKSDRLSVHQSVRSAIHA